MQNIKQKLQEFNRRPFKRWELYVQFTFPWVFTGVIIVTGGRLIEQIVSHQSPMVLVIIVPFLIYVVCNLAYVGVSYIKRYMDGIYQQYLREYEQRRVKQQAEEKHG